MKVIIVGAGIAGPVVALLLKHKGFSPVVYEAEPSFQPSVSMQLSPQTFKVLNIVGLAERAIALGEQIEMMEFRSQPQGRTLFAWDVPAQIRKETGWPMCHTSREAYCSLLLQAMEERGIPLHWGKRVVGVEQDEERERVRVEFEDGSWDEGDLLVGCDGVRSTVRQLVFEPSPPKYQGVILIGGIAPLPPLHPAPTLLSIYGDGAHFLAVPFSPTQVMFQCALREPRPTSDNWRPVPLTTTQGRAMLAALPQARWAGPAARIVATATRAYRHAACLSKPLDRWHKGRVVLIGDAASAAAPHLGQGANQAAEDAYHLVRLLCASHHLPLSSTELTTALEEFTALRVPNALRIVESSIAEGRMRVLRGAERCKHRDEMLRESLNQGRWRMMARRLRGPFEGESEI